MLGTALVGVVVNLAATWMISKADRASLNVEGAFQHILTDLFAFIATAVAGLVIIMTGFARADAIASLIVVALMVKAGLRLVRDSSRIFLEAAPSGMDPDRIGEIQTGRPHVSEVHDLHIWEITSGQTALSAHVLVAPGQDCHAVRTDLAALLAREHHIEHTTLQVDHANRDLLTVLICSRSIARTRTARSTAPARPPRQRDPPRQATSLSIHPSHKHPARC